jgi:hypothetical protein
VGAAAAAAATTPAGVKEVAPLPAWEIKGMGGVIPRMDDRLINDNMAVEAVNCDLTGGQLVGLPQARFLIDLSGTLPTVERAYRFPPDDAGGVVWLPLPSRYSSVVRSPVANDTYDRIYWTNPGDLSPHVNTKDRISAGAPAYDLGMAQPVNAVTITGTTGGTGPPAALLIDRVYTYTYVNSFNEESSPAPASNTFSGPSDAVWHITGLPTGPPASPPGRDYPPIVRLYLYRTITSATAGAQFYLVHSFDPFPASGTYDDNWSDAQVVLNEVLESTGWKNPPDYLDGLVSMPGGFLAGFTENTVHFSEPNRPHTWPDVYDQSAHYKIVNLAVWQQYLAVLTQGYPSAGSGNMPSNIMLVQTQVPEPCIARGSVVVDLSGVFYASQNGLVQFTGYGMQNITAPILEKNEWLLRYHAEKLVACRHRSQFMAVNETDRGFLVDYAETRLGFEDLSTMAGVVCVWNDEYTGDTLMCAAGRIYEWDAPAMMPQIYRWRSKQFFTPMPLSLGAVQVEADPSILDPAPEGLMPLDNGDPLMQLPAGVNAQFRYYAGPNLQLIMTRNLTQPMEIFRLPNGFKAFDHQAEITARVPVTSIQLGSTLNDLKRA